MAKRKKKRVRPMRPNTPLQTKIKKQVLAADVMQDLVYEERAKGGDTIMRICFAGLALAAHREFGFGSQRTLRLLNTTQDITSEYLLGAVDEIQKMEKGPNNIINRMNVDMRWEMICGRLENRVADEIGLNMRGTSEWQGKSGE